MNLEYEYRIANAKFGFKNLDKSLIANERQ